MNLFTKKQLWSLARTLLPFLGFGFTCLGAYLVSMQVGSKLRWTLTLAYILIALGLLLKVVGVFWTICHNIKSKQYRRQREQEWQLQVYTIERPSSFPPSYDESQHRHASAAATSNFPLELDGVDREDGGMSPAPPLYSLHCSEPPDCRWSWERPPRYSQVGRIQPGEEERAEASARP